MKALSVKPQWAAMIADGSKTIELRSRPTKYRGPLLICATQPHGMCVCLVDVVDCRPFERDDATAAQSTYRPGLWAWVLSGVRRVREVPIRGALNFFNVPDERVEVLS